ncbi:polysaccharide pyruvyl transferase family protein [Pseudoroseomonas wenyumeiae]
MAPVSYRGQEHLKKELSHHMFFSTEQWRAWMGRFDFSFGRRFHGGVMAAQAGVPFVVLAVDDRTREMLSFAKLPHMEAKAWNLLPNKAEALERFVADLDVDATIAHYRMLEARFRELLGNIGITSPKVRKPTMQTADVR